MANPYRDKDTGQYTTKEAWEKQQGAIQKVNAEKAKGLEMDKEMRDIYRSINAEIQEELEWKRKANEFDAEGNKFLRSKADLEAASNSLKRQETSLNEQIQNASAEQLVLLEDQLTKLQEIQAAVDKQAKDRKKINKALAEGGGSAITMLGKLPGLSKASEKGLAAMEQTMVNGGSEIKGMQVGLKVMAKEAAIAAGFMVMAFAANAIKEYSNLQRDVGRQLAVSATESAKIQQNFKDAAWHSKDMFATTKALSEMNSILNDARGTGLEIDGETLVTANRLLKTNVLSEKALTSLHQISNATGQSLDEAVDSQITGYKTLQKQTGIQLSLKSVMEATSKVSNTIKVSLAGSQEAISKAVFAAKALGLELSDVENIAGGLVDFNKSIEAELEAELFLGKQLNLEQARLYALTNDYEGLVREIGKQGVDFYSYSQMNRLEQEKYAAALNMSRDSMSDMLLKGADLNALAKKAKEENNEELLQNIQQISIQDTLNQSMEKMKSLAADVLTIIMPIVEGFASMVGFISESRIAMVALGAATSIVAVASVVAAIASIYKTFAAIPYGIGLLLATGVVGGLITLIGTGKNMAKAKDGVVDPQGGLVVSGPKGSVQLDKDDSVVAGTDLAGARKRKGKVDSETKDYRKKHLNALERLHRAQIAAGLGTVATIAYSGFDAVKRDKHHETKFR